MAAMFKTLSLTDTLSNAEEQERQCFCKALSIANITLAKKN
jgi:hypothetical protein